MLMMEKVGMGRDGRWEFASDGSGTWTRVDRRVSRHRSLREVGLRPEEVVSRITFDASTGERLGPVMRDYATAKCKDDWLPEPIPRDVRTVFAFNRTSAQVAPECCYKLAVGGPGCADD